MWNYARALDSYDAEAYAAKFTVGWVVCGRQSDEGTRGAEKNDLRFEVAE
jgi:hypothetical protein